MEARPGYSLDPFSLTVSATASWTAPTERTDGTPMTALDGFKVYYGTSSTSLTNIIDIMNPGQIGYVVENLDAGPLVNRYREQCRGPRVICATSGPDLPQETPSR